MLLAVVVCARGVCSSPGCWFDSRYVVFINAQEIDDGGTTIVLVCCGTSVLAMLLQKCRI